MCIYKQPHINSKKSCTVKLLVLRDPLLDNCDDCGWCKGNSSEVGISMEHQFHKKKQIDGKGSGDEVLGYEAKQCCISREKKYLLDFNVHVLSEKCNFLVPSNVLDEEYDCQLDDIYEDIEKE